MQNKKYFGLLIIMLTFTFLFSKSAKASFTCGTSTVQDADGNTYNTVLINDQCWMATNLKVGTKLASGATMPTNNGTIEKWCYNNDDALCNADGGLYHWDEAMQYSTTEGAQGICPTNWHIPTDAEQYALENYLKDDGQTCDANRSSAWDCSTAGTKLKSGGSSGFNAPLAGYRSTDGSFYLRTPYASLWSSSASGSNAWYRFLYSGNAAVGREADSKAFGFSVRCLKDPDITPPTLSLDSAPSPTNTSFLTTGTATDTLGTVSNIESKLDSGSFSSCTADDGTFDSASEDFTCNPGTLTDGSHTMYFRATDDSANTTDSGSYATLTFTYDSTSPENKVSDIKIKNSNSQDNDEFSKFSITYIKQGNLKLEGENPEASNGQLFIYQKTGNGSKKKIKTINIDSNGNWDATLKDFKKNHKKTLYFRTVDESGNESELSKGYEVFYDNNKPQFLTPPTPNQQTITKNQRTIHFQAQDEETEIDRYTLKILKSSQKKWKKLKSTATSYTIPAKFKKGTYTLVIRAYDKAGNRAEKRITINVK